MDGYSVGISFPRVFERRWLVRLSAPQFAAIAGLRLNAALDNARSVPRQSDQSVADLAERRSAELPEWQLRKVREQKR
jgi:hypothetical protein